MDNISYHDKKKIDNKLKLREILKEFPPFAADYFRAMEASSGSSNTRVSYAYDIRIFFNFLLNNNPVFKGKTMRDITLDDLDRLQSVDIEEYEDYLRLYEDKNNNYLTNGEKGLSRKMSALRSFYNYYYKRQVIKNNPSALITMPKIHEKAIIRLDPDEVAGLLDYVENCADSLSKQQKVYYEKSKYRDIAILTLLLGTGIRVSECVGLDLNDVDFKNSSIKVTRKGGNQMYVYFGDEVENALKNYLEESRKGAVPVAGHENALFLSSQRKRISVRTVEEMVKKYTSTVTPNKHITPHKLRSTYGTTLYRETGDIYLVAEVLGHKDVNTTRKHYAALDDERRKMAAGAITLREKKNDTGSE